MSKPKIKVVKNKRRTLINENAQYIEEHKRKINELILELYQAEESDLTDKMDLTTSNVQTTFDIMQTYQTAIYNEFFTDQFEFDTLKRLMINLNHLAKHFEINNMINLDGDSRKQYVFISNIAELRNPIYYSYIKKYIDMHTISVDITNNEPQYFELDFILTKSLNLIKFLML